MKDKSFKRQAETATKFAARQKGMIIRMDYDILLCGVGGQGTVLASKLTAYASMLKGMNVRTAETIGMAQRGGSVVSHVRIGDEISTPLVPLRHADMIIAFEPAEAVRSFGYLKPGGTVIVNNRAIKPVTSSLSGTDYSGEEMLQFLRSNASRLIIIDGEKACAACGSYKALNVVLLGAAASSGDFPVNIDEMQEAIKKRIPEKFHAMNLKALEAGVREATLEK